VKLVPVKVLVGYSQYRIPLVVKVFVLVISVGLSFLRVADDIAFRVMEVYDFM